MYIAVYYLPKKISLFKYAPNVWTWHVWGDGEGGVNRHRSVLKEAALYRNSVGIEGLLHQNQWDQNVKINDPFFES
jgi:hypothetical protein